jgi:hypothetical protein
MVFFCKPLFVASGKRVEVFESIDEGLSAVAFSGSLSIDPPPRLRWLPPERIVAHLNQPKAVSHSLRISEMKKRDGCTPTCGYTFNQCAIEANMAMPSLLTWMEEEDDVV